MGWHDRNREDRNDGHDRHGELDPGLEFVRPGPRARPSSSASLFQETTSCPPGQAMVGDFPTIIPMVTAGSITESTCRWGLTARPSITSRDTSPFLRNRCSSRRITTHSRREASGIFPTCGAGGDHPMGGPPTGIVGPCPFLPTPPSRTRPVVRVPRLNGRVEAAPLPSGGSGLTP